MATWIGNDKRERARVTYRGARALGLVDTQQRLLDHVLCLVVAAENPVGACEHPPPKLVMLTGRDQLIEPPAAP